MFHDGGHNIKSSIGAMMLSTDLAGRRKAKALWPPAWRCWTRCWRLEQLGRLRLTWPWRGWTWRGHIKHIFTVQTHQRHHCWELRQTKRKTPRCHINDASHLDSVHWRLLGICYHWLSWQNVITHWTENSLLGCGLLSASHWNNETLLRFPVRLERFHLSTGYAVRISSFDSMLRTMSPLSMTITQWRAMPFTGKHELHQKFCLVKMVSGKSLWEISSHSAWWQK